MATTLTTRLPRISTDTLLNGIIVLLILIDGLVAYSVVNQRAEAEVDTIAAEPSFPTTTVVESTIAPPDGVADIGASVASMEMMQTSLVVAQGLQLQNERPIEAGDMGAAIPSLTFVNGFTAAGNGVIGVSAQGGSILLLTQEPDGLWVCAAAAADGSTSLGSGSSRDALLTVEGCTAAAA